ncbi:hypothetical protein [Campylobacter geochelonis]|uniref:hypothetical protein n=1 Tax=Campylobacter geochelonis TaxID=1780362 RepID=UPI000770787C|nr:hypothetical protein [Campylobacter geochelonis]CZE48336.1 Uncharacterised protein [Campylobacter geochelonis]
MIIALIFLIFVAIIFGIDYIFFFNVDIKTPAKSEISRDVNKTNSSQYLKNILIKE